LLGEKLATRDLEAAEACLGVEIEKKPRGEVRPLSAEEHTAPASLIPSTAFFGWQCEGPSAAG
jgi:hypothetical protein